MKKQLQKIMLLLAIAQLMSISVTKAQTTSTASQSLEVQYTKGKSLYEQKKYTEAIEALKSVSRAENSPYAPYASFFFALSALEQGDYDLARNMLKQIQTKFPQWDKLDQVSYWLTDTYFRQGKYYQALQMADAVEKRKNASKDTKQDVLNMKSYFLAKTTEDSLLQDLLKKYPDDKMIAEKLVNLIAKSFYDTNKQLLLDSLVKTYNLDLASLGVVSRAASIKKKVYNVAVMLPFLYSKLSSELTQQGNQFVLDLYQGMSMAAKDLQREGINVRLNAYDTQKSYDKTMKLLEKDELKTADVIIGPLYPGPVRAVAKFSQENQVYMFNPLSNNPQAIGENPYSYLTQPSIITEAKVAARFALDSLPANKMLIIAGNTKEDSLKFNSFIENYQKDNDKSVEVIQRTNFNRQSMDEMVDTLKALAESDSIAIYVTSDNELLVSNFVSAVVMSGVKAPIIGNETWLKVRSVSIDQLNDLNIYLLDPGFTNFENKKLSSFVARYRKEKYDVPNKYVLTGYDMMYYIGQMLNKHGIYFQEFYTEDQKIPSLFYSGYSYFKANDNQEIPIIKFDKNDLVVVKE